MALLNGAQQAPPIDTPASGCATFVVDTAADTLAYHVSFGGLTGTELVAHIHGPADPGTDGPVLRLLESGSPKIGVWHYPPSIEADLLAGRLYVNVHTTAFPDGEMRGQIVDRVAVINDTQSVPPTGSGATGFGLFNLDTVLNRLSYYIAFEGLESPETFAHIHGYALHTERFGILHTLALGSPKIGTWTYQENDEPLVVDGALYVNIHSEEHFTGEVRGQIVGIVAPLEGAQVVPPVVTTGYGCMLCAHGDAANTLSYDVDRMGLSGSVTTTDIHGPAPPGSNAPVVHDIGTATPVVGTWTYPAAMKDDVLGGRTYVDVHTSAFPAGEVRGQIVFPLAPCPADVSSDRVVGIDDVIAVLRAWGAQGGPEDLDGNGVVGRVDLSLVLAFWGPCS